MLDKVKKQLTDLKRQHELKKEMETIKVEVADVRGIKIVINGAMSFQSIEIDESLLSAANKNRIQMDLLRSVNTAIKKSQQQMYLKMKNTPGFNLPGMT